MEVLNSGFVILTKKDTTHGKRQLCFHDLLPVLLVLRPISYNQVINPGWSPALKVSALSYW